jgi:hypothetical protein
MWMVFEKTPPKKNDRTSYQSTLRSLENMEDLLYSSMHETDEIKKTLYLFQAFDMINQSMLFTKDYEQSFYSERISVTNLEKILTEIQFDLRIALGNNITRRQFEINKINEIYQSVNRLVQKLPQNYDLEEIRKRISEL